MEKQKQHKIHKQGKVGLAEAIKKQDGYILSVDTLRVEDLLVKFMDFLDVWGLKDSKAKEFRVDLPLMFEPGDRAEDNFTMSEARSLGYNFCKVYNKIKLKPECEEEASYYWNEDIFNYLNNIAPNNYYFGSSEGDGSCIGFFSYLGE